MLFWPSLAVFCPWPRNLTEAKLKSNGRAFSHRGFQDSVTLNPCHDLLIIFIQVYNEASTCGAEENTAESFMLAPRHERVPVLHWDKGEGTFRERPHTTKLPTV